MSNAKRHRRLIVLLVAAGATGVLYAGSAPAANLKEASLNKGNEKVDASNTARLHGETKSSGEETAGQVVQESAERPTSPRSQRVAAVLSGAVASGASSRYKATPKMVTDTRHHLVWERKSSDATAPNYSGLRFTVQGAQKHVRHLNAVRFGGRTDWRMPTTQELWSLVEPGRRYAGLSINTRAFPEVGKRWYWADDGFDDLLPSMQRVISYTNGNIFVWPRTARLGVMAVAGRGWIGRYNPDNPYVASRYTVDARKETVIDKATGLQWEQQQSTGGGSAAMNTQYTLQEVTNLAKYSTAYVELLGNLTPDMSADPDMSTSLLDVPGLLELVGHVVGSAPGTVKALTTMLADAAASPGAGSPFGPHSWIQHYTFDQAEAYIDYLNDKGGNGIPGGYAGKKDWRLPSATELLTITDQARAQWPLVMPVFNPSSPMGYWTGQVNPATGRHYFIHGLMVLESLPDRYALNVRAVRGTMKPLKPA